MACRFPGAGNLDQFWQNLKSGVESISTLTDEELKQAGVTASLLNNPNYVKARGVLEDVEMFDASLFEINPREAEIIDPQHRLFLEQSLQALEHAGYDPDAYKGLIGIYAGVSASLYLLANLLPNVDLLESVGSYQTTLGNDKDYLTTRVSYKLNLKGPSVDIQTGCSTSLVAVHLACQGLLNSECDIALAGGVTISFPQKAGYLYQEGNVASPDGHCRSFDAKAQGTTGGNGLGIVVLKRFTDALADGDCIHAVIRGTAINNDGSMKVGYMAPSIEGQAHVISMAQELAGTHPESITYIEAHGTATALGDPIEIAGLKKAFERKTNKRGFCAIGSVKTNIGHLDTAAGVAGLIKTVLMLNHRMIPASLHFEQPNPGIDFANSPFYVNHTLREWEADKQPRRAGVSSLGIGGTNAHVILEEAPPAKQTGPSRPWQMLMLSAKTPTALQQQTENLVKHLADQRQQSLPDIAYTLQVGRKRREYRRAILCRSNLEATEAMQSLDAKHVFTYHDERPHRPVVFMFPGQGTQSVNVGKSLYGQERRFRDEIDRCAESLVGWMGVDLREVLYPKPQREQQAREYLKETYITQPALFTIEYAMAKLWMAWGIQPAAMIGHSIGEYVAACISGVMDLPDALRLVAARGRLMQSLPKGAMLSVAASAEELQDELGKDLSLAAVNGPRLCVVAGNREVIAELREKLNTQNVQCRLLETPLAFHSHMVEPVLEAFAVEVQRISFKPPKIPYISNVTGTWVTTEQMADAGYWVSHMRQTVKFDAGLTELLKNEQRIFLEAGPRETLSALLRRHPARKNETVAVATSGWRAEDESEDQGAQYALATLWLAGANVNWGKYYEDEQRARVPLPTYPFQREKYWIEPRNHNPSQPQEQNGLRKIKEISEWLYLPTWKRSRLPKGELRRDSLWLIFMDECGIGEEAARRIEREGPGVIRVTMDGKYAKHAEGQYRIRPGAREDYEDLLRDLSTVNQVPDKILHMFSVTRPDERGAHKSFKATQEEGSYSLLFITQVLGKLNMTGALEIVAVSNNMQDVTGDEELRPDKATLLGSCKVIPQEYPNIICRSIDISIPESTNERGFLERFMAEITAKPSDLVTAHRGKHRWVEAFEPMQIDMEAGAVDGLREGGVYLILGGLGTIGLDLARHLAQATRAKLILTGRSPFPEPHEWERWLSIHGEDDLISRKIRKLQTIEGLEAEVITLAADLADPEKMHSMMSIIDDRFGHLDGVIYVAGLSGEIRKALQEISEDDYEDHFQAKVHGLVNLERLLGDRPLDFCVIFSSLASVLGGLGNVAYASANLFVDAFVHRHNLTKPVPWVSVNWDGWREDEQTDSSVNLKSHSDDLGMTTTEGLRVFDIIRATGPVAQVIVSTGELKTRIDQWVGLKSIRNVRDASHPANSPLHARPNLMNAYVAPTNESEQVIVDVFQNMLGIAPVGIHDNFFDLGGHSLLAIQIISRLREVFHTDLSLRIIFDAPTPEELAIVILQRQAGATDDETLAKMLAELEQLSELDAESILESDEHLTGKKDSNERD